MSTKNSKTKLLHGEKGEKKRFHYTGRSYRIATVLQVFNYFKNWRCVIFLFKNINKCFMYFLNKFLLADFR